MKLKAIIQGFVFFTVVTAASAQSLSFEKFEGEFKAKALYTTVKSDENNVYFISKDLEWQVNKAKFYWNKASKIGGTKTVEVKYPKEMAAGRIYKLEFISLGESLIGLVQLKNKKLKTYELYAVKYDRKTLLPIEFKKLVATPFENMTVPNFHYSKSPDNKRLALFIIKRDMSCDYALLEDNLTILNKKGTDIIKVKERPYPWKRMNRNGVLGDERDLYSEEITNEFKGAYLLNDGTLFVLNHTVGQECTLSILNQDGTSEKVALGIGAVELKHMFIQRVGSNLIIRNEHVENERILDFEVIKFSLVTRKVLFHVKNKIPVNLIPYYYHKDHSVSRALNRTLPMGVLESADGTLFVFDQEVLVTSEFVEGGGVTHNYHSESLFVTCLNGLGEIVYHKRILKRCKSITQDRVFFTPIISGNGLELLIQDHQENLTLWKTGNIKIPALKSTAILSSVYLDVNGNQTRERTGVYDQKARLFINNRCSPFINNGTVTLMLYNENTNKGTFVNIKSKIK